MNEFFTWELLATLAGCTVGTALITQFIKEIPDIRNIPTQFVSFVIAVAILAAATAATVHGVTWQTWAIIPLNAVIVSLSANGGYEVIKRISKS